MPETTGYKKPSSLRDVDFAHYLHHYSALVWRWKWWFVFSAPLAAGIAAVLILKTLNTTTPVLPATVTLGGVGGEPIAGMVMLTDEKDEEPFSPDSLAQAALIKNRDLLRGVVDSLSLRLKVSGYPRSSIFDTVAVDSLAPSGKYQFKIGKKHRNAYCIFRKESIRSLRSLFHHKVLAARGTIDKLDSLQLPGVRLRFNRSFLQHPHDFIFSISNIQKIVEELRDSVSLHASRVTIAHESPSFSITIRGNDYMLTAATVNMIADKFVERNIRLRQARSQNTREIVIQQIKKADSELAESEENLKTFRSEHPTLGLSTSTDEMLSGSLAAERINDSMEESMRNAQMLQGKLARAAKQDLPEVCSEILVFLNAQHVIAAPFLANELSRLIEESHRLQGAFDKNYPLALKNQAEIKQNVEKVTSELADFIKVQKQRQIKVQSEILASSRKIQALPTEELKLAELSRLQQIKADIHAKLLDKFYLSTVSDVSAADIPDFYVMDYALPPIPPPQKVNQKVLIPCLFLVLMLLFGPMILADLTSKTVRTEYELKKILDIDILETIPEITLKRGAGNGPGLHGLSDTLIVNSERFKNDYVNELFRLLRSKIHHRLLSGGLDKTIVITSLESDAGKSTIAANIAIAMAQQNLKTVIIDGDLRLGTIHRFFNIDKSPGLSEFLIGDQTEKVGTPLSIHHPSAIPMLSVISSGEPRNNAGDLIASHRLQSLITTLAGKYDVVLFDSPPIGIVADALSINRFFSHYLLVIRAGRTNVFDLREKIAEHPQLGSKLMGVVLNFATINRKISYYKRSKYYFQAQEKTLT